MLSHSSSSLPHIPTSASITNWFVTKDALSTLRFPFHYYYCDGLGFPFVCLHLLRHALYFLWMDFYPCLYIYINKITYFPIWITLCIFGMQLISYNMVCSSILESQGKGLLVKNISNIFLMSCCPSHIQEDLGRRLSRKPCKEGYQRAQAHPSQPS
jgi:hypothetical protein